MQNRDEWLAKRKRKVNASEAGAILGVNPHDSAMSLWLEKTGRIDGKEETLAMWLGHEMEPIIAKRYEMETGRILHNPGDYAMLAHKDHDWLCCTRDRTTVIETREHIPVELKAPGERMAGDWGDGSFPLTYNVQLQIQMACMGAKFGEIAAIVGNDKFHCIRVARDDEFLEAAIPILHEFWQCVMNDVEPAIDGSEATRKAIRKLHPNDSGESIQLDPEWEAELDRMTKLEVEIDELKHEHDAIKNRICYEMGANTYAFLNGERVFSYKTQNSASGKLIRVLRRIK